ncbi:MAG: carbohydrate-binding domain-containing protein, partial [Janthinobacterium lividum]
SDGTTPPTYHDWHTGAEDTSTAQFIADPVNRTHYWSNPAATEWSSDSSGGHSQSLTSLIQFAEQHGKAFAIPEAGAGNSNSDTDVTDDAAYPQWLAQQLTAAQLAGEKIAFVNTWDSNGGGNYEFTSASDNKPSEAAAWATSFGAQQTSTATPTAIPAATTLGSGPDTLSLQVSEDAWQGDAQYTVSIDGTQVGSTQTATAAHAAGQMQLVDVLGTFGAGLHTATVTFLNDAYGGTPATDRNLYISGATIDGTTVASSNLALLDAGPQSFSFTKT